MSRRDDDPFDSFPLRAPEPVPGCPECDRLVRSEKSARVRADLSGATDERVRLRTHLEVAHRVPSRAGCTGRGRGGTRGASRPL
ncbi:hypothetical protein JOC24_001626 [Streptomyces sp. HB132]|nr:hypothetical protein [Streptomyces sp. HB132]